ncbi:MAG: pentapeptide repeat-containing protein [Planctomycetes bacterium]|nr:pentapeptide repeat-containing protein [Planctomycetota bacterium]
MTEPRAITLLHLSDIQFGKEHRFRVPQKDCPDGRFDTLIQRLKDDLTLLRGQHGLSPDLAIVTGDLAEWAMPSEFEDVQTFLGELTAFLKLQPDHVVLVPGNHDVNWKHCVAYFSDCEGDGARPREPYFPKWRACKKLLDSFYKDHPPAASFTEDSPWTLHELKDLKLAVAGLNSTMAESHEVHHGLLGEGQLRWFQEKLTTYKEQGWLRVGALHHNIRRNPVDDEANLRDEADLNRYLGETINLFLHGHRHEGKLDWLSPKVPILATGSAAVEVKDRPPEVPNQYQIVQVWPDRLKRWCRGYSPGDKKWIGDNRASKNGDAWWREENVGFEAVHGTFALPSVSPSESARPSEEALERLHHRPLADDFLSRVAAICRIRYAGAAIERMSDPVSGHDYLRVSAGKSGPACVHPVSGTEGDVTDKTLDGFLAVHERYRRADPGVQSAFVYGGAPASEDLARKAANERVWLVSFTEFQGLIDLRPYVSRQTERLANDRLYPHKLYVPQRMTFQPGEDGDTGASEDALESIFKWLQDPLGRFVLVLGDFGTGKSFLLRELTRPLGSSGGGIFPVLIEMRALEKGRCLDELAAQHFARAGVEFNPTAFRYMLEEGRIALLFDGFDELALRLTYDRAAEHFDTILAAAAGKARVVVTSRTQHFESDRQVLSALSRRVEGLARRRVAKLQPFDDARILRFLSNQMGDEKKATERLRLLKDVPDLAGLSQNPRMLAFIAALDERRLRAAKKRAGHVTSGGLYKILLDQWLGQEVGRVQPPGAPSALVLEDRRRAVTEIALRLWEGPERTVNARELAEDVAWATEILSRLRLSPAEVAHQVGSGTLLVRDEEGGFSFIHQSVMEWLVADRAARELGEASGPRRIFGVREMSPLMADFLIDLAGRDKATAWGQTTLASEKAGPVEKKNALLLLSRANAKAKRVRIEGKDFSGADFSGQDLSGADLSGANLTAARLVGTKLEGADLSGARLQEADLTRATLSGANLAGADFSCARLLGADLRGAEVSRAIFHRAKLVGAQYEGTLPATCDTFGAALPKPDATRTCIGFASACNAVAMGGPSGEFVAGGHDDGSVRVWEQSSGACIVVLRGHRDKVISVAFSPDGLRVASGSSDKTVRLWDLSTGKEARRLEGHGEGVTSVAFSPDGLRVASGSDDKTVRLWDLSTGKEVWRLEGHTNSVTSVAFSPDGLRLASGSDDRTVRLWDLSTGIEVWRAEGHGGLVTSVAFSPDGSRVASGSWDKTIRLWDLSTGKELRRLEGHTIWVMSVAFSSDGARLAGGSVDGVVRVWDLSTGKEPRRLEGHTGFVASVAFSPDGSRLASGSHDNTVRLWDLSTGKEARRLEGHRMRITNVASSPNGARLASGSWDKTIRLWDLSTGKEARRLEGHTNWVMSVAFSPDGSRLASGSADSTVRLWDLSTGKEARRLEGHTGGVLGVAFSPDGLRLAGGSWDETVWLWDLSTGEELRRLEGHTGGVLGVAFSPDGLRFATGSEGRTVRLWDLSTGKELRWLEGHTHRVTSATFSPDGTRLASGSYDCTVRLWDLSTGRELRRLEGHTNWVTSVAFSPDGFQVASGSGDSTVRLWDLSTGKELRRIDGFAGTVNSIGFVRDGSLLAAADANGIQIHDARTAERLATLVPLPDGWAVLKPTGEYKLNGESAGAFWFNIGLCRFEPGELEPFLPSLVRLSLDAPILA